MTAIAELSTQHQALLTDYRSALNAWTEAKAAYSFLSPEVVAATRRLEELERQLANYPVQRLVRS